MREKEDSKKQAKRPIKSVIYSEYLKAALLPILIVELTLLVMYFAITNYVESSTKETLLLEAKDNIQEIATREAKNINQQIAQITNLANMLQKKNSWVFNDVTRYTLPNPMPVFKQFSENQVTYKVNNNGGSSVWYSSLTPFGEAQLKKALLTETMDPDFKVALESNPSIVGIYFNSYDSMCRYYPYLDEVYFVFDPKMNIPLFNFYYLADEKHNPEKKTVWTDVYLDPAGQGWMASCITPIYNAKGSLEGVTGIDITVDKMIQTILNLKLPWQASAFLVDQNGVILAMPQSVEEVFELKELREQVYESTVKADTLKPEEFNLFKNPNADIAKQIEGIWTSNEAVSVFHSGEKDYYLAQSAIPETGWRLMMLVDQTTVLAPVVKLDQLTQQTGFFAFTMMLIFYTLFFTYLMYKSRKIAGVISQPITEIASKTSEMRNQLQEMTYEAQSTQIEEIDLLSDNFSNMASELKAFTFELENKVALRTQALTEMYEKLQLSKKELEDANMQIIHQEKMASIGQLAAGVAHEINNPMGFVISNITQLQKYSSKFFEYYRHYEALVEVVLQMPLPEEQQQEIKALYSKIADERKRLDIDFIIEDVDSLIEDTLEGTQRVKNIVQELKTFSRNDVQKSMADINAGIESVVNMIWNELKYKAILHKDFGELPLTYCNVGQLNQVFLNILMNAAHAIDQKGEIRISTSCQGSQIQVKISDTGHGMDEAVIAKIFDPFFTTKEIGKGTGLGLSISYEIIKSYGGNILVESVPNQGTTFTVLLPVTEAQEV